MLHRSIGDIFGNSLQNTSITGGGGIKILQEVFGPWPGGGGQERRRGKTPSVLEV